MSNVAHVDFTEGKYADTTWYELTNIITTSGVLESVKFKCSCAQSENSVKFINALANNKRITRLSAACDWASGGAGNFERSGGGDAKFNQAFQKYISGSTVLRSLELHTYQTDSFEQLVGVLDGVTTNLVSLSFGGNYGRCPDNMILSLMSTVGTLANLTRLRLMYIGNQVQNNLPISYLSGLTTLVDLDLNRIDVFPEQVAELEIYSSRKPLKSLNITLIYDAVSGYRPVTNFLKIENLRTLTLHITFLVPFVGDVTEPQNLKDIGNILNLISINSTLKHLELSSLAFNPGMCLAFLDAVSENTMLTHFGMQGSKEMDNTMINVNILEVLNANTTLRSLTHYPDYYGGFKIVVAPFLQRNLDRQWKNIHRIILDAVLGMRKLHLPAYVLLEIVDWLPNVIYTKQHLKIKLILGIINSAKNFK